MTVNAWLDLHMDLLRGRKIRLIEQETNRSVTDLLMYYLQRDVIKVKLTSKFIFLYV
jgi:hypothetical protein